MALVAARTDFECKKAAHGISLFLVDTREHKGFTKGGAPLRKIGQPTYDTAELFFDNVRLPNRYFIDKTSLLPSKKLHKYVFTFRFLSALLGEEKGLNRGFYFMMDELPRERLGGSIDAVSQLEYAFEITKQYKKERKAFGESISQKQAIRYFKID